MSSTRFFFLRADDRRDRRPSIGEGGRWGRGLLAAAGLLGASGVAVGAASAHLGGGDLARLAACFLLIHAAAIPGVLAVPLASVLGTLIVASLLALGTALFSGDVALLAFTGHTPVAGMAPLGGFLLIAGWLGLSGLALFGMGARSRDP